jgi:hypothetical protein
VGAVFISPFIKPGTAAAYNQFSLPGTEDQIIGFG